jgi:hypothetical protein
MKNTKASQETMQSTQIVPIHTPIPQKIIPSSLSTVSSQKPAVNPYERILNQSEIKNYDDNGDLVCANPDDDFYDGEDICKPVNLQSKEEYNEWRDQENEWDQRIIDLN